MTQRSAFRLRAVKMLFLATAALAASVAQAQVLRACADPDNLPFSKASGAEKGVYVELAELVGAKLGRPVEFDWYYTNYERRALRNSILAGTCDALFSLPAEGEYKARGLARTRPFLQLSYVAVADPAVRVEGLADLKDKRIGVQFQTPPHVLFALDGGYRTATFREPEELYKALADREIDVAFLWGPVAGYENDRRHAGRWRLTPIAGEGLQGSVSVAVRRNDETLKVAIDEALDALKPEIAALAARYGFPTGKPVDLGALGLSARKTEPASGIAAAVVVAQADTAKAGGTTSDAQASKVVAAPAAAEGRADEGKVKFNDICSHCHGVNGASPISERDLRRLKRRYDDKWPETAHTTIVNGRPDAGMPTWKGMLSDQEIRNLLAFLVTVQR